MARSASPMLAASPGGAWQMGCTTAMRKVMAAAPAFFYRAEAPPRVSLRSTHLRPDPSYAGFLPEHQRADYRQIDGVGENPGGKCRRIGAVVIVKRAREPSSDRHAAAAAEKKCRDAPVRLRGRKQLANGQNVGWDDARKAQSERGGDREQADFILHEHERRHGGDLACRTHKYDVEAAHAIGDPTPKLSADKGRPQQHRQHRRAVRSEDAEIAAKCGQMGLRNGHRDTTEDAGGR